MLVIAAAPGVADAVLIPAMETFDSEGAAAANGWTTFQNTLEGNNFGFSSTNNTGGVSPAGEAGGVFARSLVVHYYADTALGGTLTRGDPMSASGEFDVTAISTDPAFDGGVRIGHFHPSSVGDHFLGWVLLENTATTLRARPQIVFDNGLERSGPNLIVTGLDVDRTWSYVWEPMGGAGFGRLTFAISGLGGGTSVLDLTSADSGRSLSRRPLR